jgi:hypothetical protein
LTPIAVLDLATGERSTRPHDTLTLDVPGDFLRVGGVFTVADGFRASYTAIAGKQVIRQVTPRPLSWRLGGEVCLVARSSSSLKRLRQYRLCTIEALAAVPLPLSGSNE